METIIYPEMGQKTNAEIEFKCSHSGGFYITTDLNLSGRGIKMSGDGTNNVRGKKTYQCTVKAMDKLKAMYSCCYIALLD